MQWRSLLILLIGVPILARKKESRDEVQTGLRVGHYRLIELLGVLGLREAADLGEALQQVHEVRDTKASSAFEILQAETLESSRLQLVADGLQQLRIFGQPLLSRLAQHYVLDDKFAAGSHGEVWKAHRADGSKDGRQLIIKRIYGARGAEIVLAGLREVLHGPKLLHKPHVSRLLDVIVREESPQGQAEYHVGERARERARLLRTTAIAALRGSERDRRKELELLARYELWLVFEHAGVSLKSLLYDELAATPTPESPGVTAATLLTPSELWFRIRAEEAAVSGRRSAACTAEDWEGADDDADLCADTTLQSILRQLLQGVAALHEEGMAHRDIKPSNLVLRVLDEASLATKMQSNARAPLDVCLPEDLATILYDAAGALTVQESSAALPPPPPPPPGQNGRELRRDKARRQPSSDRPGYGPGALTVPAPRLLARPGSSRSAVVPKPLLLSLSMVDFSSALNAEALDSAYFHNVSFAQCTMEYLPPEFRLQKEEVALEPDIAKAAIVDVWQRADLWAVGMVWLELLLGSRDAFRLDQRTASVLLHTLRSTDDLSQDGTEDLLFLAALAEFCVYSPPGPLSKMWPECNELIFAEAIRRRDDLDVGLGQDRFAAHLLYRLLQFDPSKRISAKEALEHAYFTGAYKSRVDGTPHPTRLARDRYDSVTAASPYRAIDSDPTKGMNGAEGMPSILGKDYPVPKTYTCPKCARVFGDWGSCHEHARLRKHGHPDDGRNGSLGFCSFSIDPAGNVPVCEGTRALDTLRRHDPKSGWCEMRGRRSHTEDFMASHYGDGFRFFGVFDGHWGTRVARYVSKALFLNIEDALNVRRSLNLSSSDAMFGAFARTQNDLSGNFSSSEDRSGATATAVLVMEDEIIVANIGDSRAILCCGATGATIQLTVDHTAADPRERKRVEATEGGFVEESGGIPRVQGKLAVTRAFGDPSFQQFGVISEPFVAQLTRSNGAKRVYVTEEGSELETPVDERFIVVASDGLWDVLSNEEVTGLVQVAFAEHGRGGHLPEARFQYAAERLAVEAYIRGSTDNIGVSVIDLQ